jgi:transcriptional repressor NrdR
MICPKCTHEGTRVLDSRETHEGKEIRRRRQCEKCAYRFTTFERVESNNFVVIKKDGSRESYIREKLESGVWRACEKRPITKEQVDSMLNQLEEEWSKMGKEISSKVIGENLMEKLRTLDEVAYIRFASVYRHFKDIETFRKELDKFSKTTK